MLSPPSLVQRSKELLVGRDVMRLALRASSVRSMPPGDGGPVVTIAGFGAGDASMLPLCRVLRRLGHHVRPARLGRVTDDVETPTRAVGRTMLTRRLLST